MHKYDVVKPLIAIGVLVLVVALGAETYYTHRLSKRLSEIEGLPTQSELVVDDGAWDPWSSMHAQMMRMRADVDQLFDRSFQNSRTPSANAILPSDGQVSLQEQGNNYLVKAQIPGAKESDIQVHLDGRLLSISAQTQGGQEQKADNGDVLREETYASSYQRAFTLPSAVDAAGMHSQYHDGVLTVTIPKATS